MTANAFDQSNVDLYFDNSTSKWEKCYVYIGKDDYTSCFDMTRVSGTQYLWKLAKGFDNGNKWNGAKGWVVCKEKWWSGNSENVYKFVYHGNNNVTDITTSAWSDSKIYKANGTQSVNHFSTNCTVYKVTNSTKSDYKVTINTVEGGTLTVKDYDDQAVASGDSKIHLTVLKFSATPASGYVLDAVEINDGTNTTTIAAADLATTTHTLTSAITINPVWRATTSTVTVTATATNGTVTGGGVVEEGTSVTLTATPDAGYQFVNWTVGGAEVSTANPYTFTAEEDVTVVANFKEIPKVTIYAVNNAGWENMAVHHWIPDGEGTDWPGDKMAKTGEKAAGDFDVYSATFVAAHTYCIFNNSGNGKQTEDLAVQDGYYYDIFGGKWYATLAEVPAPDPLVTSVYLVGDMNSWNQSSTAFRKATAEGTTASVAVELTAGTHEFKIVDNGAWYGNDGTMDRVWHEGWTFSIKKENSEEDQVNAKIYADFAGTYTFTWDMTNKKLTVTFPELPKYTVTTSATEGGSVTEGGEFTKGTEVKLTATPAEGYHFEKWSNESTENPLTITVTEDVELQAIFAINVYDVTATAENGKVEGAGEYKHGAQVTLTATPAEGYKFVNWTKGENVVSTESTYTFTITEDVELVANFQKFVVAPTISGKEYFHTTTEVSISAADGLTIYYTLDGADPTITSKKYTEPFTVEETATVKAIAHDGEIASKVASKVFSKLQYINCDEAIKIAKANQGLISKDKYFIHGYVTEIEKPYDPSYDKISFWLASSRDGGRGLFVNNIVPLNREVDKFVEVGQYVELNSELVTPADSDIPQTPPSDRSDLYTIIPTPEFTISATAENGTVTGAGTYEIGTKVTLTATPNFDYYFVNWTVGSTEVSTSATYTFTVETDIELVANFKEIPATTMKSGKFSVGANKTAVFTPGNLQYHTGSKEWRFAKQQYQVVGEQNIEVGNPDFKGWIDMLGWSNGEENDYGVNPSNANEDYDGEFVDWGTLFADEDSLSTLTADEWNYLLYQRDADLKQLAQVGDVVGIMLFPDNWLTPEDAKGYADKDEDGVRIQFYTLAEWEVLENTGAIFLPAAGRRTGGWGNIINYDQVEENNPENLNGRFYRWQDNTNVYSYYWSSTKDAENLVSYVITCESIGNDEYILGTPALWKEKGRYGQSVRLAKVTTTSGGNTGTNLDNILVGEKAAKVIINGKLVIIKNGKAYNAMGQEI